MADIKNRERAQNLRRRGFGIAEISKKLKKPKSTISFWCRDISLTKTQLARLTAKSNQAGLSQVLKNAERLRDRRQKDIVHFLALGKKEVGALTERDLLMVGLGLYWGEGYKQGNQEFGFSNSDPAMMQFFISFLKKIYQVETKDLIARVSINHIHATREKAIKAKWSWYTKIPTSQFTKTSLIKTNSRKVYTRSENYLGTLRVKVKKGTNLRRRILGSISRLQEEISN